MSEKWEGGRPPVGAVCLDSDGDRVEVIAHHFEHVVCYMIDYAGYQYVEADPGDLRAIRDGKIPGVKLDDGEGEV